MKPHITIVIPAYNEERILTACLASIRSQTEAPEEIIVVDNNSIDKTASIAKSFGATVIRENRQGISFARSTGFREAATELIARIDADTELPPHWIATARSIFTDSSVVGATGPVYFSSFLGSKQLSPLLHHMQTFLYFTTARWSLGYNVMIGSNMVIRKSLWDEIADSVCLDDTQFHEDTDLTLHIKPYGSITYEKSLWVTTSPRRFYNLPSLVNYSVRHVRSINHGLSIKSNQVKSPSHG